MPRNLILSILIIPIILTSNIQIIQKNKKYCIAKTKKEKYQGLLKYKTKEEFKKDCNGKLYFIYKENKCRIFTMKNMKYNIYITDNNGKSKFKMNDKKNVCGKVIIETLQ